MRTKAEVKLDMWDAARVYVRTQSVADLQALRRLEAEYRRAPRGRRRPDALNPSARRTRRIAEAAQHGWELQVELTGDKSLYRHTCGHEQLCYHAAMRDGKSWCPACQYPPALSRVLGELPKAWEFVRSGDRPPDLDLQRGQHWFRHSCGDERGAPMWSAKSGGLTCEACSIRADPKHPYRLYAARYGWEFLRVDPSSAKGIRGLYGQTRYGILRHRCGVEIKRELTSVFRPYCPKCEPHIL